VRKITEIIIHCSATPEGKDYTVADIDRWHKANGWKSIGYHYVIYRDGSVHIGRPVREPGAHCKGHNQFSIGVCYIGGLSSPGTSPELVERKGERGGIPKDTRTPEQKDSLRALLEQLREDYPQAKIYGHYHFANKACPSFDVASEYAAS